ETPGRPGNAARGREEVSRGPRSEGESLRGARPGQIKQGLESITDAEKRKSAEAMLEGLSTEEQMKRLPNILKLVGTGTTTFGTGTPASQATGAALDEKKERYA